jgi:hypothetical protein
MNTSNSFGNGKKLVCSNREDETEAKSAFVDRLLQIRRKLAIRISRPKGLRYWAAHELLSLEQLHARITQAIKTAEPMAVGRLGGVEGLIVRWACGIPGGLPLSLRRPIYRETTIGATNAGIRPRNRESYRLFGNLAYEALGHMDLRGVWKTDDEAVVLSRLLSAPVFNVETIAPSISNPEHWMRAMDGKRVLVVSPFETTIQRQIPHLAKVWSGANWKPEVDFRIVKFPYLIDESYPESWWEVYNRIGTVVSEGDYDVALFGCGGLGLPFAALAKAAGRVGIHLGGHLQLLFGICGQRHLDQHWHGVSINSHWVRPDESEVPQSAQRVENRCYW